MRKAKKNWLYGGAREAWLSVVAPGACRGGGGHSSATDAATPGGAECQRGSVG